MKKQEKLILAELGDELLIEKLKLEKEKIILNRRIKNLDINKKEKNSSFRNITPKQNSYFRFQAYQRILIIKDRLTKINKELKN